MGGENVRVAQAGVQLLGHGAGGGVLCVMYRALQLQNAAKGQ